MIVVVRERPMDITETEVGVQLFDILSALKGEDSHGTVPLIWDGYGS